MKLFCPSNLDLVVALKERGHDYWLKHIDKLYYLMLIIYRGRWGKAHEPDDFIPVNAKRLRQILGTRFARPATELLIEMGIIETNRHYLVGERSRGYRFSEPYRNAKFRLVKQIPNYRISAILQECMDGDLTLEAHKFLFENQKRVTIDDGVAVFLEQFQAESERQRDYYERSAEDIRDKEWRFASDKKTGRVFNNITSLPKQLRQFLRLDGKPLVEIDVANCQPLLLLGLYNDADKEREEFRRVVENGNFYETIDVLLEKPYGTERRSELKDKIFTQVFFDRVWPTSSKLCQAFQKRFPVLYERMVALKAADHRRLALRLQSDEARIVISKVVTGIASSTRIPILTIHDSVLTKAEHVAEVKERLEAAFKEQLGVKPTLKIKTNPTPAATFSLN